MKHLRFEFLLAIFLVLVAGQILQAAPAVSAPTVPATQPAPATASALTPDLQKLLADVKDSTFGYDEAAFYRLAGEVGKMPDDLLKPDEETLAYKTLLAVPSNFRGQPVTIRGQYMYVAPFEVNIDSLKKDVPKLYECTVRELPMDQVKPICTVVTIENPLGHLKQGDDVITKGFFYKVRAYEGTKGIGYAPMLVARRLEAALAAPPVAAPPNAGAMPADLVKMADEVAKDVEILRGWKFKAPVKKALVTEKETRAWMEKEVDKQLPREKSDRGQAVLRLVGLVPPNCDVRKTLLDLLQGQVEGFYDPDTKILSLVERPGVKRIAFVERIMLAHELTHALDDQYADLAGFVKKHLADDVDADLAAAAVLEGSATFLMTRYMLMQQVSGELDMEGLQQYVKDEAARTQTLLSAPRYFTSMLATYMCGMNFLARGNLAGRLAGGKDLGDEALAAFKDPPRSTTQVLHPEKYWDPKAREEPVIVNDDDMAKSARVAVGGDWGIAHKDTIGELMAAVLTTPKDQKPDILAMQDSGYWTNEAAAGWAGDRFYLLARTSPNASGPIIDETCKGIWITLWNTPKDRDEFVAAYDQNGPAGHATFKWAKLGAVFFFRLDESERKAIVSALEKSPPRLSRDSKPWSPAAK